MFMCVIRSRLAALHRIFNRSTSTLDRAKEGSVAGHKFPRSMAPDLLRSVHGGNRRLLDGNGRFMRHVKLGPEHDINAAALTQLIKTAYTDMKKRVNAEALA